MRGARRPAAGLPGQAMMEFALVVPVFVLLMFGVMDFGKALYAYSFVSYAAREASRYAAVHGQNSKQPATSAGIQSFVNNETAGLNTKRLVVTTTWSPDEKPGSVVKVQVQYSLPLSVPLLPATTISLWSVSQMVISQ